MTDPSGTVVPNATVALKNMATNDVRQVTSGNDGTYKFTNLLPGNYELAAEATGFKKFVRRNIELQAGLGADVNVRLEVGTLQQTVEVTDRAVLLNTETATSTASLDGALVSALPTNTKSPLNFVFAFAGTTEAGPMTQTNATVDQMFSMFSLQGGRSGQAQVLLDGAPATAIDWGGLMVSPTVEAVQEMQFIRNTYDAQYGKGGAGIISLVSRGGTNDFHFIAYDFLQNDNLNAKTWLDNKNGTPKAEFKRNQFGANFSGPIWKRKNLYFMAAYEGLRQPFVSGSGGFMQVPTLEQRQGDFSKTLDGDGNLMTIHDPFSTSKLADDSYTRTPFAGNRIPSSRFDPVGAKIVNLWAPPNRPGDPVTGANNFYAQGKGNSINDKLEWRVDWAQNDKNRIFARMTQRVRQSVDPACFFCNGADSGWDAYELTSPGWHFTINDTITPSPNWVINALVGGSRWVEGQTSVAIAKGLTPGSLGFKPEHFQVPAVPVFNVTNYSPLGNNQLRSQARYSHTAELNLTKLLSAHTLKFGASYQVMLINNRDSAGGTFDFSNTFTACDPVEEGCSAPNSGGSNGNAIASLLLGTGSGRTPFRPEVAHSVHYFGAYVQDSWRVNRKLTLNFGVRYENMRPATERFNRMAMFNMQATSPLSGAVPLGRPILGGFEYASDSKRTIWDASNRNFAPRIGLAYKVNDRLVARGGFAIFYAQDTAMLGFDFDGMYPGYSMTTEWFGSEGGLGYIPSTRLSNPWPNGINQPTGSRDGLMTFVNNGLSQLWVRKPHPTPYKSHFSFDVQYQVRPGSVFEIGYTGWRGRKLMYGNPDLNINQLPTQWLSLGSQLDAEVPNPFYGKIPDGAFSGPTILYNQLLRPFPQFTYLTMTRSVPGGRADFNALNVQFTHRLGSGLNLMSTYQFGRQMDNGSEDLIGWAPGGTWRDSYNTMLDYSYGLHDIRHSFVNALSYPLPFGKGKRFGSRMPAVLDVIAGGWELSGILRLNSGMPLMPIVWNMEWNPLSQYGFPGWQRPNVTGDPALANPTPDRWFNVEAFSQPGQYELGTAPKAFDSVRDSGVRNLDFALGKTFKAEAFRVQFRAEFLNAFNTPAFGGGWGGWANILNCVDCWGMGGQALATGNSPRNIQLGIRIEYDDD